MSGDGDDPISVPPRRGGIHPIYGLYIGGSPLDNNYQPTRKGRLSYRSHMQRRNVKSIGTIEGAIITARDSTASLKFDGQLEPTVGASVTEIGKDRFVTLLGRKVEDLGQETFYHVKNDSGEVVDLFVQSHNFTIDTVIKEFEDRKEPTHEGAFDDYEFDEIVMSRLVVESLLTSAFYEKIVIRFGQRQDFKDLPGSVLFLMALETCNSSVSYDVDKAETDFIALTLDTYPGENISDFATEAQRLIKKMGGGYVIPIHTGSRLLIKVSKTSSEEFNRKIFAILDSVKDMEYKYKMTDPGKMLKDPKYSELGPFGLLSTIQQAYSRLLSFQDWPALASKLPESNNASTSKALESVQKCFRCGGAHHVRDCPKKTKDKEKEKEKDKEIDKAKAGSKDADTTPAPKKAKTELPAWRYAEPKDLKATIIDEGRTWKFCTKCKCKKSGKIGLYILSHFDSEHDENWTPKISNLSEGNLAAVDVPLTIPAATVADPMSTPFYDDDIEFQGIGAWCASVDSTGVAFISSTVEGGTVSPSSFDVGLACDTDRPHFEDSFLQPLASDFFEMAYEDAPDVVHYDGFAFYDPEPPDERISSENLRTLAHFLRPRLGFFAWPMFHQVMVWLFWILTMVWDVFTYLVLGTGIGPIPKAEYPGRRRTSRYLSRRRIISPLLFFPMSWMILSHSVQLPNGKWIPGVCGNHKIPIPSVSDILHTASIFVTDTHQRVCAIDAMVTLDLNTLIQYNNIKFMVLMDGLSAFTSTKNDQLNSVLKDRECDSESDAFVETFSNHLPSLQADCQIELDADTLSTFENADSMLVNDMVDPFNFHLLGPDRIHVNCVWETGDQHLKLLQTRNTKCMSEANGPLHVTAPMLSNITTQEVLAFLTVGDPQGTKQPIIFDTGASLAITPDKTDFDGPLSVPTGDLRLGGMANGLRIEGIGTVTWTFANMDGTEVRISGLSYYVPGAKARLLSPQRLLDGDKVKGHYEGDHKEFRLHIDGKLLLTVEYDDRNSLPIGYATIGKTPDPQLNIALMDESNQNLTSGQKLLLHWHNRFGHLNLPSVQRILRNVPFLSDKYAAASKCDMGSIKCTICEFAKGRRRAIHSSKTTPNPDKTGAIKVEHLKPGIHVSVDHFESRLLGRTFDSYGRASSATYKGGCMFVDHATGYMHVEHQVGFSAVETIRAKHAFESLSMAHGVVIETYLTDSGTFKAAAFVQHIRDHSQRIRYCGANAHHKNGVAERAVQSVSNIARAMLLHASAHWKNGIDSSLWPMAVSYATFQYNHLPNAQGLCPADLFTGSTVPRHRLRDIHVWGCPVYVLDPDLQAGKKLPRWQPRSRRGVFVGFSSLHSSEVPLVLNLQTGSITPQYHVVFDDHFSTVSSVERETDPPEHWADLCLEDSTYIPTEFNTDQGGTPIFLDDDWLTPDERDLKARAMARTDTVRRTFEPPVSRAAPSVPASSTTLSTPVSTVSTSSVPKSRDSILPPPPTLAREVTTLPALPSNTPALSTAPTSVISPPPSIGVRRSARANKGMFQETRFIDEAYLSMLDDTLDSAAHQVQLAYLSELLTCMDTGVVDICDPRVYAAKVARADADNPTYQQAMNGSDAGEYIKAMKLEIHTLVQQRTWESVPRPKDKHVLKGTWAFKLKRLPDGTAYRYKARFCARGDLQKEGVDFFETYAPVVQWSTIRLLLSTVLTEGWTTRQVDYTNAFAQAELKEEVYVEYPRMFGSKHGAGRVLHLLKSLYGLRQAPRTFFEKLKAGLEERGWQQSAIDPCLFLKKGMICVVYVDDTIFATKNTADLDSEIKALGISTSEQQHTFALRDEGEVSAFLGIQIKKTGPNEFLLTQTGLIDKVLEATKMTHCNGCDTPATVDPLHTDKDGAPFSEDWRYDSIIGMLMYLAGNTRPDIAYAVHQAARFTHGARNSHAAGIKRILRYLQKTKTEGLILRPQADLRVDCHVDADFGGLFSVENKQDPVSVKSRTGYVILYRGAPLLWVSKMQTQIALSTMEAEYIALSQSMRDLIPIREVLKEIMTVVFDRKADITYHSHSRAFEDANEGTISYNIPQSTVYEDNDACLKFARMPKLTPRTKHIGVPYHWFRAQVENLEIHIERIDTTMQLGDQFTKGLPVDPFRVARKRLMGW